MIYRNGIWRPSPTVRVYRSIRATHDVFQTTWAAWRWYADGTESGASPISTENQANTNSPNVFSGDVIIHLRIRIDETGAGSASGASTDDWGLAFNINGGGANALTASSTGCQAAGSGAGLTDGAATTQRLTAGGGSFVAGEQEEINGVVEDHQLTADNHTEHVFAIRLVSASLANNDSITWEYSYNGATSGADITQPSPLPILTIVKTQPPVPSLTFRRKGEPWLPLLSL